VDLEVNAGRPAFDEDLQGTDRLAGIVASDPSNPYCVAAFGRNALLVS
jgi:hypothetical protein